MFWNLRRKSCFFFMLKFNRQVMSSLLPQNQQKILLMNTYYVTFIKETKPVFCWGWMIFSTMNGEVKLMKITEHQKLKYVGNFGEH